MPNWVTNKIQTTERVVRAMLNDVGVVDFTLAAPIYGDAETRAVWGTKWNACRPTAEPNAGRCQFETAWSCPMGVFVTLSERFPDDAITVSYADEDIGSNCGTFTVLGGKIVEQDIAPSWRDMDEATRAKWSAFARELTGIEE